MPATRLDIFTCVELAPIVDELGPIKWIHLESIWNDLIQTTWGHIPRKPDCWAEVAHNKCVFTINFLDILNASSKK